MNITVFCGSSRGDSPIYEAAAQQLGALLAAENIGLVYGGGGVGLMGVVSRSVMSAGGRVIGVIPTFLNEKEGIAFDDITELHTVTTMHERKMKMHTLSNGVIAMPGGYGTLDELFEILCWAQLGLHTQPVGLLNINGYYDALVEMLDKMVASKFLSPTNRALLLVADNPTELLAKMKAYNAPDPNKWLDNVVL
jgi:uncharacterized protein (TIGR00730 family)